MKQLFTITIIFFSINVNAQCDTIFKKWADFKDWEAYRFKAPTVLVLEYPNGDKSYSHYEKEKLNGAYYLLTSTGICIDSCTYANNLMEGIFISRYRTNGQIKEFTTRHLGKLHGECKVWNVYGKLTCRAFYMNGLINGKLIYYYDNGQKAEETIYRNGNVIDTTYTWDRNGKKIKISWRDTTNYYGSNEAYYNSFTENFGIGKLNVYMLFTWGENNNERWKEQWDSIKKVYYLYEQPNDELPARYGGEAFVSLIEHAPLQGSTRFPPELLLIREENGWYQVMICSLTPSEVRKLWIKKSTLNCGYTPWEKLVLDARYCRIKDLKSNPILKSPDINSKQVKCQTDACLIIKEIAGDWIKVTLADGDCRADLPNDCFDEGWVRWRNAHQLLITQG